MTAFEISIHALREEGDYLSFAPVSWMSYFYPRPPRGGRQIARDRFDIPDEFLSTPSARRATTAAKASLSSGLFLSTPSARRATGGRRLSAGCPCDFYPRPPRGGRRAQANVLEGVKVFLSTPSARRATQRARQRPARFFISIHALREEGDSKNRDKISIFKQIVQHSARI